MELEILSPIIEKIFKESLKERIYKYGISGKGGGKSNKFSSGSLYDSIKAIPEGTDTIGIEMFDYGKYVQSGRLKGKKGVPIKYLMLWIKDRHITGKDKNGKTLKPEQLAFAIQKTIKKFGIPSLPGWFDIAFENMMNSSELDDALGEMTINYFGDKLKDL